MSAVIAIVHFSVFLSSSSFTVLSILLLKSVESEQERPRTLTLTLLLFFFLFVSCLKHC